MKGEVAAYLSISAESHKQTEQECTTMHILADAHTFHSYAHSSSFAGH